MVMLGEHALDVAIDLVAIDNVLAARTAVTHLVELGRRRIACIGANPHRGTATHWRAITPPSPPPGCRSSPS